MTSSNATPKLKDEFVLRIVIICILSVSSVWFLMHAIVDTGGSPAAASLFDQPFVEVIRIVLGIAGIVATVLAAYYWNRSLVSKIAVKMAINHYTKNRMQFLILALELYDMDPSPQNLVRLEQARNETEKLVNEVDLILQEKLRAPETRSQQTGNQSPEK